MNKGCLGISNEDIDTSLGIGWSTPGVAGGNTFLGRGIGQKITVPNGGIALGSSAGVANTVIGYQAHQALTTGDSNVTIGFQAAVIATTGNRNVCIGANAVPIFTTGSLNVVIGYNAGLTITTGSSNVCIGPSSTVFHTNGSCVVIGASASGSVSGAVAIGQSTTAAGAAASVAIGQSANASSAGTAASMSIGASTSSTADGAVAFGTDSAGNGASTAVTNEIKLGTALHTTTVIGLSKVAAHAITSGALSTTTFVSGTGKQIDTTTDRFLVLNVSITLATDTIALAISADNVTYSTFGTYTPGVAASSDQYSFAVPAGWYVKVTLTGSAAVTTATYY